MHGRRIRPLGRPKLHYDEEVHHHPHIGTEKCQREGQKISSICGKPLHFHQ